MSEWSEVAQSCPTLFDPVDYSLPGSSIYEIFQSRVLECIAISFSRGSSRPRDPTWVSCIAGRLLTIWVTKEAPKRGKQKFTLRERAGVMRNYWPAITNLEDGRGSLAKEYRNSLQVQKSKKTDFTLEPPGKNRACWHLGLSPVRYILDFWPSEW